MARPANSLTARIALLRAAKIKAAKFKPAETISLEPMRELLGVTTKVLRGWCKTVEGFEESGAFVSGDHGISYSFYPRKTVSFLIAHFEAEVKSKAAKAKRVRQIVGAEGMGHVPEDYSIDDTIKMLRASTLIQEQRERQGQLIDGTKAAALFRDYHSIIQQSALRAGQEQDPNGRWPPDVRESFEDAMRSVLLAIERGGREVLAKLGTQ